jgi:AcrR family transcriptional regulator
MMPRCEGLAPSELFRERHRPARIVEHARALDEAELVASLTALVTSVRDRIDRVRGVDVRSFRLPNAPRGCYVRETMQLVARSNDDVRERVLDAAQELGDELGDAGLTMRHVASRAGVQVATMYQSFASKAALLRELQRGFRAHHDAAIADAFATADDPAARLHRACVKHVELARARPWRTTLAFDTDGLVPDAGYAVSQAFVEVAMLCLHERGIEEHRSRYAAALRLWVAVHGLASALAGPARDLARSSQDEHAFVDDYIDMLMRGIGLERRGSERVAT